MNISITPELERFIQAKVESGMYGSASEVVREALRVLARYEEERNQRIAELNRKIQVGLDQIERGEVISAEDSIKMMEEYKKKVMKERGQKP